MTVLEIASRLGEILDAQGISYLVGGSLASSLVGEPRSTMDIDVVVDLDRSQIPSLVAALGDEFLVDPQSLGRAVRERTSTNFFHAASAFKIDMFMLGSSEGEREQMRRRQRVRIASNPDRFVFTYTPEDIALQKLRWYRLGDERSDRQWRDVVSILRLSGARLDRGYLRRAAHDFGIEDLLERATQAAADRE